MRSRCAFHHLAALGRQPFQITRASFFRLILGLSAAGLVAVTPFLAQGAAGSKPGTLCDRAARIAAGSSEIPFRVLRAITRVETGRRHDRGLVPWPWTVNMEGRGKWFETRQQAHAYVKQHMAHGARSFDVGCFQINHRWHGNAFRSIDDMFDPLQNARYAAAFLTRLYIETGNWPEAAGLYHSRTPKRGRSYQTRFERILASIENETPGRADFVPASTSETAASADHRATNGYPLMKVLETGSVRGSLVPLAAADRPALFTNSKQRRALMQ